LEGAFKRVKTSAVPIQYTRLHPAYVFVARRLAQAYAAIEDIEAATTTPNAAGAAKSDSSPLTVRVPVTTHVNCSENEKHRHR
jgi:hypothetical protein